MHLHNCERMNAWCKVRVSKEEKSYRPMIKDLNPKNALIFRIIHRDNMPWVLDHGLYCRSSNTFDPHYVTIGNPDLIERRSRHPVPLPPGGTLDDYVPFYFTPYSPMLYNIKTGYGNIRKRGNNEIVVLVSSLNALRRGRCAFYSRTDTPILRPRSFTRIWPGWTRLTRPCCRSATLSGTPTTQASSSATKLKLWYMSIYQSMRFWESVAMMIGGGKLEGRPRATRLDR